MSVYFFTHLFISRLLYAKFKDEADVAKWAFAFGNVKPDLPPDCFKERHTLENCLFIVYDRANQLTGQPLSKTEFSVKLGEICHFVCDFFCRYHLNESLHKQILPHLFYEIRLHIKLYVLSIRQKAELLAENRLPVKNIASMIFELRREYLKGKDEMKKDLIFALDASVCAFRFIQEQVKAKPDIVRGADGPSVCFREGGPYEGSAIC